MRRCSLSGVPPGDLKSPDLPIVETGPFLASIRFISFRPRKLNMIAMSRPADAAINVLCRVIVASDSYRSACPDQIADRICGINILIETSSSIETNWTTAASPGSAWSVTCKMPVWKKGRRMRLRPSCQAGLHHSLNSSSSTLNF
jgi:hypothetical protein